MEGYYQYTITIDEGDAQKIYTGLVYSENGFAAAANRIGDWYKYYGTALSVTLELFEEGAVCEK